MTLPPSWQEAARFIEPWIDARVLYDGKSFVFEGTDDWRRERVVVLRGLPGFVLASAVVIDLSHPDTRVAFDRRLLLRLGAPEAAVDEWFAFRRRTHRFGHMVWQALAGNYEVNDECPPTFSRVLDIRTHDPLLARALAWKLEPG